MEIKTGKPLRSVSNAIIQREYKEIIGAPEK